MRLKANFHLHTADDPRDNIKYTTYEVIDRARELGLDVLAVTCHTKFVGRREYVDYARSRGILLISGIEAKIEDKDVVVLNCTKEVEGIKTLQELGEYKKKNPDIFILAPHPFVPNTGKQVSLGRKLKQNIDLFDAIELSVISNNMFDFNRGAREVALEYNKPLIATSDCHFLKDLNRGYAIIETEDKTVGGVLRSIKRGGVKNELDPMGLWDMVRFKVVGEMGRVVKYFKRHKIQENPK